MSKPELSNSSSESSIDGLDSSHRVDNDEIQIQSTKRFRSDINPADIADDLSDNEASSPSKNSKSVNKTYQAYPWSVKNQNISIQLRYTDIINFDRTCSKVEQKHCVMCGSQSEQIPVQNKDVCKKCDTTFWLYLKLNVVVKFCKGMLAFDFSQLIFFH